MEIKPDEFNSAREYYEFKYNIQEALIHLESSLAHVCSDTEQAIQSYALIDAAYSDLSQMNFKE